MQIRAPEGGRWPPKQDEEKPSGFGLIAGIILTVLILIAMNLLQGR